MAPSDAPYPHAADRDRWIVGVDGSDNARHALEWATTHGPERLVTLRVVHVWRALSGDPSTPAPLEQPHEPAESILAEMRNLIDASHDGTELIAAYGTPAGRLIELADDAELLVVGSRGLGGFHRLLLGSTSHQCATHSPIPVVVVPQLATIDTATRRIVVGVDGSDNSKAALRWALRFAGPGTTVEAVGSWAPTPFTTDEGTEDFDRRSKRSHDVFHRAIDEVEDAERSDNDVQRVFMTGTPETVLSERAVDAQLLVVGARGRSAIGSALLGSVSYRMLHRVAIPIVVVPDTSRWSGAAS